MTVHARRVNEHRLEIRVHNPSNMLARQAGVTLTGLLTALVAIGLVSVIAIQVVPTYTEFQSARSAIVTARTAGNSERDIRASFDRQADISYIKSLSGRDLEITSKNGVFDVSFAYQKVIHLVANVSLQMDYAASTATNGARPLQNR